MKFRWKIFFLCIAAYMITLFAAGIIVISSSYNNMIDKEIIRCLKEEENLNLTTTLYLLSNKKLFGDKIDITNYSASIVDMFGTKESYMEVYNSDLEILASNMPFKYNTSKDELKTALFKGRNYVLRREEGKHLIYITSCVKVDGKQIVVCTIKDITYIDDQKKRLYTYFLEAGVAGFAIVAFFTGLVGRMVLKPVYKLIDASKNIASGNFKERVNVKTGDEIGILAEQFNIMAKEVENRIEELKDEGEKKQRFIDNLTHELRTPLTSIIGYSDLMMNIKYDESTFQKSLGFVKSEGQRMLKMIASLMDMILARENSIEKRNQGVMPLLEEVLDIMAIKAEKRQVILSIEGKNISSSFDYDLIKGAVINLVDNAINACSPQDSVTLGSGLTGGKPFLYIRDTGRGISSEEISRITEPFYRVDKSRSRKEGGAGLGLSICSEILRRHGAKMEIESEIGKGTTVWVRFQGVSEA